jgi:hypothetical protein
MKFVTVRTLMAERKTEKGIRNDEQTWYIEERARVDER